MCAVETSVSTWLLDSRPKSDRDSPPATRPFEPGDDLSKRIVCAACGHAITHADARIERGGQHIHTRLNPTQVTFVFGCFSEAPGATATGDSTTEYSWFHAYAWRLAWCGGCSAHLGWRFEGEAPFWALIFEKLSGG